MEIFRVSNRSSKDQETLHEDTLWLVMMGSLERPRMRQTPKLAQESMLPDVKVQSRELLYPHICPY